MIHHTDTEREDREVTRELYIVMGILWGCVMLAVIVVTLLP